jgi:hypothetical protein
MTGPIGNGYLGHNIDVIPVPDVVRAADPCVCAILARLILNPASARAFCGPPRTWRPVRLRTKADRSPSSFGSVQVQRGAAARMRRRQVPG